MEKNAVKFKESETEFYTFFSPGREKRKEGRKEGRKRSFEAQLQSTLKQSLTALLSPVGEL